MSPIPAQCEASPPLSPARIRVAVVHAMPVMALGLAAALRQTAGFDVQLEPPGEVPPGGAIDVIVCDQRHAIGWSRSRCDAAGPGAARPRMLVVDASAGETEVRAALAAGVHGYLLSDCALHELVDAITLLGKGGRYLCPSVAVCLAESLARAALTRRETAVLSLMVEGNSDKLIARQLGIAVGTVKVHAKTLYGKLGVGTRNQAMALAHRRGLLPAMT